MSNKTLKEILTALSLANILFAGSWRLYLYPPTFEYHIKTSPGRIDYLGIVLAVIITASVFFGTFRLIKYLHQEKASFLANLTFSTLFLFSLNIFRLQFEYSSISVPIAIISQVILLITVALMFTKWQNYIFNTAKIAVLLISPFVLITFSQALLGIINYTSQSDKETSVSSQLSNIKAQQKENIKNRIVWIVFDEFDYRIPFELKAVEMPEFERLKKNSLSATNAHSPARNTLESIPALLTGKKIKKSIPIGREELTLQFPDNTSKKFSEFPNVFSKVKDLGGNTAVDGFYHSYCRVIGKDLSVCKWISESFIQNNSIFWSTVSNYDVLYSQLSKVFAYNSIDIEQHFNKNLDIDDKWHIKELIETPSERLEDTLNIVTDPKIDLAFIHLPIPHPPSKYLINKKKYSPKLQNYVNNLALTDVVLGDIRKVMEDKDLWNSTTVIISTEHSLRVRMWGKANHSFTPYDKTLTNGIYDERVPFFVKLKNQKESVVYEKPFSTIVTHDLILDLMNGKIGSPDELKKWLDTSQHLK